MNSRLAGILMGILLAVSIGCSRENQYKIGVSQCSNDDWRAKMNEEIVREMMFHPEATVEIRSADDSNERQIADIRYFIDNGFDVIIAAPNEADAITPVLSEAYQSGIPVVVFDRGVNGNDYTARQGADNESIGHAAADYAIQHVGKNAPAIEIRGLRGSTPAYGRHTGFTGSTGINVVGEGYGNWNYEDGARVADSLLELYPETAVIYAHNDRMAIAAADVARKRGLSPLVIGIDAAPEIGLKAVADSVISATFIYPTEGHRLVRTALAILEGEPYDTAAILPATSAIDATNVGPLLLQYEGLKEETARMERLKAEVDDYWLQHSMQTAMFYAVLVIVLLLAGLLFMVLRAFWQHRRHQAALGEAMASKLAFFTNVSHDLRTPLTLIAEPVEQLAAADNLDSRQRTLMKIADKNVRILRRLINQILDFRKYEHGKWKLVLAEADFSELVSEWGEAFSGLAKRRDIKLKVDTDPSGTTMAIDIEQMERVFYNLVSNAFKYTPDNGSITVSCHEEGGNMVLKVSDSGEGISAEDLPMIFDHFFQGDKVRPKGSGIGLALAKAFVELHGGTIRVESQPGKGTTFTVVLPIRHVENRADELLGHAITAETVDAELGDVDDTASAPAIKDNLPTVLVIDDNSDIRAMLKEMLRDSYNVQTASDGAEGLRMAARHVPDLVVCDVMMPEMDGLECCARIKGELSTSHIPVLMLTACAMDEQRVNGYDVGADGYVSKPFNSEVLLARIRNLISNRKRIFDLWGAGTATMLKTHAATEPAVKENKPTSPAGAPDIDNDFYKKFLELVDKDMGNPDLNVEELASSMGLGRSQFYRKIKSLTNYSPVELLRRLRMARARDLLTTTERTISEISYAVGISTPAYFTKCYKEAYGETPSELRERLSIEK